MQIQTYIVKLIAPSLAVGQFEHSGIPISSTPQTGDSKRNRMDIKFTRRRLILTLLTMLGSVGVYLAVSRESRGYGGGRYGHGEYGR